RRATFERNGGRPLANMQLHTFCCATPQDATSCFGVRFLPPGVNNNASEQMNGEDFSENLLPGEEKTDDGTMYGWNWPISFAPDKRSSAQLRMSVKHVDCCFPGLRDMCMVMGWSSSCTCY
ncbi:unnamed protein product, partial [Amoebophrya sp. A25]